MAPGVLDLPDTAACERSRSARPWCAAWPAITLNERLPEAARAARPGGGRRGGLVFGRRPCDLRRVTRTPAAGPAALIASALAVGAALGGCRDHDWLQYSWDDRRVLCSRSIEDVTHGHPWGLIAEQLEIAQRRESVALLHAHTPGQTVSLTRLDAVFDFADSQGLDYVTYPELVDGAPPRAAVALAFDDHAIDAWFELRGLFAAHRAHVTFFISELHKTTAEERAKLAQLAAEGHSIQAHGVAHLDARKYVDRHGLDAYLADEALPSIEGLRAAGYAPTVYAYPFGAGFRAVNEAMLQHVQRVRVGPAPCPY